MYLHEKTHLVFTFYSLFQRADTICLKSDPRSALCFFFYFATCVTAIENKDQKEKLILLSFINKNES